MALVQDMIAIAPIKSLPDGSVATIPMSWAEYQQLVAKRGDRSTPRLKYANGYLTLKMPTFEHGQLDALVADLNNELMLASIGVTSISINDIYEDVIGSIPKLQIYPHFNGSMRVSGEYDCVFATLGCSRRYLAN